MDRFAAVKRNLTAMAEEREDICALVAIGSRTRTYEPADEYSDLDVIMVTTRPDIYLDSDEVLSRIGEIRISFVEPTIGGGRERRMLLEGSLDVDLIVLTPERFISMVDDHTADEIMSRGYAVLYDGIGVTARLEQSVAAGMPRGEMSEGEFLNMVNDFWFHIVWAAKKLCRGELWTAKMCVDAYMKGHLLRIIELYHKRAHGEEYDVWHNGRMLEKWAQDDIVSELGGCFCRYDAADIAAALGNTAALFARLAAYCARSAGWDYPAGAEKYAMEQMKALLK